MWCDARRSKKALELSHKRLATTIYLKQDRAGHGSIEGFILALALAIHNLADIINIGTALA
ncbi:9374_t:CDS:2 [Funneliformis mosseae]|uniref:9374_t:CDS:1 n=1 Tax=Funneliformis mosseae TaxID=27381 RepID=A0A9N9HUF2_FUNMO|nr:9374_t:CDS:2 [Funneliformis mosseae]